MIVFLSGPLLDQPDHHKPAFDAAQERLEALGHTVINPARRGTVPGWGWTTYARLSIADLIQADAISQLDGWHTSREALLENRIAQELHLAHVDLEATA